MENRDDVPRDGVNPEAPDEGRPSIGQWLASNGFALVIVLAALGYVIWEFDAEGIWAIVKALLGLSFVIFIHELGHFLAAKWCDVNVTTFSIGFGPPIPGCWFQWGETVYKLALFPLGGYVQMVGQVDGDEASDGSEDDPRSYRNKSVGQRMLIISAGVIMNAVLAFVCFIIVYTGKGKDRTAGVINIVDTGAPAFSYGIRTGMTVRQIGDTMNPNFEELMIAVVFSHDGEQVKFVGQRPQDAEPIDLKIEPRLDQGGLRPVIGVSPPQKLEAATRRLMSPGSTGPYVELSPAANATSASGSGLKFGDVILATTDPDQPAKLKDLPRDPRNEQKDQKDFFEFQRRMMLLADREVKLQVRRAGEEGKIEEISVPRAYHLTLGVRMKMGQVLAVRENSPAAKAGVRIPDKKHNLVLAGDVIQKVELPETDGSKTTLGTDDRPLDPERLPYQLQQWAQRTQSKAGNAKELKLYLKRHRQEAGGEQEKHEWVAIAWDDDWRFERTLPLHPESPLAIPELGLAYQVKPEVADVIPGVIADNPLQKDDEIKEIEVSTQIGKSDLKQTQVIKTNWANVSYSLYQRPALVKNVKLTIQRGKETLTVEIVPVRDESWPLAERGWLFMADERRQKADGVGQAIYLGLRDTWNNMKQVGQTIYGMVTGRLSVKNLGGPITIATTAYRIAGYDNWDLLFFMGLISINLAVINFLPIPVLDGGHMVFLAYEKIRGKQASEAVRIGATYAGLAVILSLMVFVIYLDLTRKF